MITLTLSSFLRRRVLSLPMQSQRPLGLPLPVPLRRTSASGTAAGGDAAGGYDGPHFDLRVGEEMKDITQNRNKCLICAYLNLIEMVPDKTKWTQEACDAAADGLPGYNGEDLRKHIDDEHPDAAKRKRTKEARRRKKENK